MYKTIIMTTAYVKFQLRRDTYANWSNLDPVLFTGEPAIETDTHKMKIGDGATHYLLLPYVSGGNDRDSGTAPAPSYTFSADLSSGMFMPSVSNVAFSTRGVERMRIDNSGSIGIGTSNPQYTLDLFDSNLGLGTTNYVKQLIGAPFTYTGSYSSTTSNSVTYYKFLTSGTLTMNSTLSTNYFIVGGGGGGAGGNGGGGGAGGLQTNVAGVASNPATQYNAAGITLSNGSNYTINVGGGGALAAVSTPGSNGSNSVLSGTGITTITALGGGGGGGNVGTGGANGNAGGCGGGAYSIASGGIGSAGYNGGAGTITVGGGGGGGGIGVIGTSTSTMDGGAGGNGITYTGVTYGGGGGGGSGYTGTATSNSGGTGGTGGGGTGGRDWASGANYIAPTAGTANTGGGGGGGGGRFAAGNANGSAGGSGIVILSFPSFSGVSYPIYGTETIDASTNFTINASNKVRLTAPTEWHYITSNISTSTITTTSNTYGTLYNITATPFTGITLPSQANSNTDNGSFWTFQNSTTSVLTPTITYTSGSGAGSNFTLVPNSTASILWTGTAYRLIPAAYPVAQPILDICGSATIPTYSFSADASSGMFMPSVSNVAFSTRGVERMRIDNSGNLQTFGNILDVCGTATVPSYSFLADASSGMFMPSVSNLAFTTRGIERMRIDNSGNMQLFANSISNVSSINMSYMSTYSLSNLGISGLIWWLDSADLTTLSLTASNTVTNWTDKSITGSHLLQATAGSRPTYSNDPIIGRSGLYFSGGNSLVQSNANIFPINTISNWTSFAVFRRTTTGATPYIYSSTQASNFVAFGAHDQHHSYAPVSGEAYGTNGVPGTGFALLSLVITPTTMSQYLYGNVNGSSGKSTASPQVSFMVGSNAFTGYIYEIVFFDSALSTSNRQLVEGALAWKWGQQALLSNTHPYYSVSPIIPTSFTSVGRLLTDLSYNTFNITAPNKIRLQAPTEWHYINTDTTSSSLNVTSNNYGSLFNITTTLSNITLPSQSTSATDVGSFWTFQNSTASTLTPTITYTSGSGLGSSITIPPTATVNVVWTGTAYRLLPAYLPLGQAILNISGTAVLPSYSFSADSNTGMYISSLSNLSFATKGLERMRIDNSGNSQYFGGNMSNVASLGMAYVQGYALSNLGITGLTWWIDSADSSTLTLSNSNVTNWTDKSATGAHLLQNTVGSRPIFSNDPITNRSGIYFSGANTLVQSNTSVYTVDTISNWSIFAVFRKANTGGNPYLYSSTQASFMALRASDQLDTFAPVGAEAYGVTNIPGAGFAVYSAIVTPTTLNTYINGSTSGSSGKSTSSPQMSFMLGSNSYNGYIYEMAIYNTALSTSNRQLIEGALAWKWGQQALLASSHPYYTTVPNSTPVQVGTITADTTSNAIKFSTNNIERMRIDNSGNTRFFGNILDICGSATVPAYSFLTDASSGMYSPAISNLAFSTKGTESVRINASGWVGIGTTTPTTTLDVSGQFSANIRMSNLTGTSATIDVTNPKSMHYYITDSGFNALTVTNPSSGTNVGAWARLVNNAGTASLSVAITNGTGLTTPMTLTSNVSTMIAWNGTGFNQF